MLKIELIPDIENCVQHLIKNEYENILRQLLAGEGDRQLKEKIELLTMLLEKMDLKQLRQESEKYLCTGKNVKFTFYAIKGEPKYEMKVS